MTNSKCTYCGEHHRYQHELVCDNVRPLYPLHKTAKEAAKYLRDTFESDLVEQNKALRGDLIHKNTELLEERKQHRITKSELDIAKSKIKKLRSGNYHQGA